MKKLKIALFGLLLTCAWLPAFAFQAMTSQGQVDVIQQYGQMKKTYTATMLAFAPVATPTDIFVLNASPTKTINITKVRITAVAQGNNTIAIQLVKRTTANTGGTTAAVTITANDSADVPSTTTAVNYTTNPTSLSTGSNVRNDALPVPATANPTVAGPINWTWGDRPSKSIVLKANSTEKLAINLNGATMPTGLNLYINVEWTEE